MADTKPHRFWSPTDGITVCADCGVGIVGAGMFWLPACVPVEDDGHEPQEASEEAA